MCVTCHFERVSIRYDDDDDDDDDSDESFCPLWPGQMQKQLLPTFSSHHDDDGYEQDAGMILHK